MKTVAIALVILSLASVSICANWEYAGNWTTDNTTAITTAIDESLKPNAEFGTTYNYNLGKFAKSLSEYLETTLSWHQFWNVFVVVQTEASDTVVYGYAFKSHWLWKNNVQFTPSSGPPFIQPSGKNIGLVIWKDYNCQTRVYSTTEITDCTFSQEIKDALSAAIQADARPRVTEDIWATTYNIVSTVSDIVGSTVIGGANRAYSAVVSQDKAATFYAALCHATEGGYSITPDAPFGTLFLFQTRDYANA